MIYYNDNEPYCCDWLRNLMRDGLIEHGTVDERSIHDVQPADLAGHGRVHLFAGLGGWDYALQLADWPLEVPVWTCSCPCQPFSAAGKRRGTDDPRHLWPVAARLVAECRPPILIGEQVASPAGREWLAGVRADLVGMGYAFGAADLPAASVGAPIIRQRLWWAAVDGDVGLPGGTRPQERTGDGGIPVGPQQPPPWEDFELAVCPDGKGNVKIRRVKPGVQLVVAGVSGRVSVRRATDAGAQEHTYSRVGALRAIGNSIVPQVAAAWCRAVMEATGELRRRAFERRD